MNTTNRISDKGQPWKSLTHTLNKFNFVPRTWTQLLDVPEKLPNRRHPDQMPLPGCSSL